MNDLPLFLFGPTFVVGFVFRSTKIKPVDAEFLVENVVIDVFLTRVVTFVVGSSLTICRICIT